jgi:hypothetical protein
LSPLRKMDFAMPEFMGSQKRRADDDDEGAAPGSTKKANNSAGKGGGKGARGGGRGQGLAQQNFEQNDHALLQAVANLSLGTALVARELVSASIIETILVGMNSQMATQGLQEGKMYNELAQQRKGQNIGSPHIRIALKCLKALSEEKDLDKDFKELLACWWKEKILNKDTFSVEAEIKIWKVQKPQTQTAGWKKQTEPPAAQGQMDDEEEYSKFTIAIASPILQEGLLKEMARLFGATRKSGVAPREHFERKVLELLRPRKN